MSTIKKIVRTGNGFKERLHIKSFKTNAAMHIFLNKQPNNDWVINSEPDYYGAFNEETAKLKAGKYAYAGGQWHNVKSLDASVLAHI